MNVTCNVHRIPCGDVSIVCANVTIFKPKSMIVETWHVGLKDSVGLEIWSKGCDFFVGAFG